MAQDVNRLPKRLDGGKSKRMKTIFLLTLSSILLCTGCATGYRPGDFFGGYSDTQLAPDVFRVHFGGNGYTSQERAQDFAMLRAAELTLHHNFTCFSIARDHNYNNVSTWTTPGYANTSATATGNGFGGFNIEANTIYTPPLTQVFYKPQSDILIKTFKIKPDATPTFDAFFLQQSLREKYSIKPPKETPAAKP